MRCELGSKLVDLAIRGITLVGHGTKSGLGETEIAALATEAEDQPWNLLDALVHPEEGALGHAGTTEIVGELEERVAACPDELARRGSRRRNRAGCGSTCWRRTGEKRGVRKGWRGGGGGGEGGADRGEEKGGKGGAGQVGVMGGMVES